MKLQFLGAVRQVTGSKYYLETDGTRILVDCGMYQERDFLDRNWNVLPVRPRDVDLVLLTHAHIDHCGLLPKFVADGFHGKILATAPTCGLVDILLRDSAQIQAEDAEFKEKRHRKEGREGRFPVRPLYTLRDVERTLPLLEPVSYHQPVRVGDNASAVFHEAGHILGAAMVELIVQECDCSRRIVFSGDLGMPGKPFVRSPDQLTEADWLVLESTYGDRDHADGGSIEDQLATAINEAVDAGGKVLVPIFAVERAQELLYYLGRLVRAGRIPSIPAYLDSPMAADVNKVFARFRDWFDPDLQRRLAAGETLLGFPGLTTIHSVEESKALNHRKGPAIIMATNGMCTAGRVKHHLAQYIDHPECTILFVGYQGAGTLGRQILDGRREVRLHGRLRWVKAKVRQIEGFSGHADRAALLGWLRHFAAPPQVFVTHGEEEAALALAQQIREEFHWNVTVPEYQQIVEVFA
jgi:metallo-beta-lactamase family protein